MKPHYETKDFFKFLGYPAGATPYSCVNLRSLSVYCRADRNLLESLLEPTPFVLADDRFLISIADFGNSTTGPFMDAGIVIPVRYGNHTGSNYFFEFEDHSWSVSFGREVWGYPKKFASISLSDDDRGAGSTVKLFGETFIDVGVEFDASVDRSLWSDMSVFPHLQVRAVPQVAGENFDRFDIVSRNTSRDYELLTRQVGRASVQLGPGLAVGGVQLKALEVLGGEFTVGNYLASAENGLATTIGSLV